MAQQTIFILNERDIKHPLAGGAEVHLVENFSRIAAKGYRVVSICAGFPGGAAREKIRGIEIVRVGNRYTFYFKAPLAYLRLAKTVTRGLLIEDLNKLPFFASTYSPFPVLGLVHHLFGWTAFRQVSPPVALATIMAEKAMPRFYRRIPIVAVSPSTRDDLVERGFDTGMIRVITNGLDHRRFTPGGGDPPPPVILSLGRIEPYKRLDLLLSAFALVRRRVPAARLVMTGSGAALPGLQRRAASLGLNPQVEFKGFVSEEEKVSLYQRARVLANPSEKEGWGLTVLEANACGTPAVASDVPGLRDAVRHGETGLLVPHGNVGSLAEALVTVLTDDSEWRRLRAGALEWSARFSWDRVAAELTEVVEEVGFGQSNDRTIFILNERDIKHPLAGGAEVHLFENFSRIAAKGYKVVAICTGFPGAAPEEKIQGINVLRVGNRYSFYLLGPLLYRRLARRTERGILVEALNKLPFLSPMYSPLPVVAIVHHLFGRTAFRQVIPPIALATVLAESAIPAVYRRVTMVAISPSTREDLIERGLGATRIKVVSVGLDTAHYRPAGEIPRPPVVLSLGRVERYKRLDLLVSAFEQVAAKVPEARLVITGTGGALKGLRRQVTKAGLEGLVSFRGFVSEAEKVGLYQRARVVVNPSEKEGWGLTVLEANACGTPVVATDVPGLRDAVKPGETGLLVPYDDAGQLAEAIVTMLLDDKKWRTLRDGALAWAAQFSWERSAEELRRLLEEVGFSSGRRAKRPEPP